jgi:hypothetical protein
VVHVVTQLVMSRHVYRASGVITTCEILETPFLDLLGVLSGQACKHLLQTPGQAIGLGVLHDFKPPKFPFRMIKEQGSREFRKRMVEVQSQGSEVILKDKAPTTP